MPSSPPLSTFHRAVTGVLATTVVAVGASLLPVVATAAASGPKASAARALSCPVHTAASSPQRVARYRRTVATRRARIARYQRDMARHSRALRRARSAGTRRHHARAIARDARAIARLRRALACQTRYVSVSASSAGPATGPLHVGVSADTQGWGSQMGARQDAVSGLGVKWLREEFSWRVVQPSAGTWDWSRYDQLLVSAAQHGDTVLPVLISTPSWAGPTANTIPSDPSAYAAFVAAVAARYGPGGSFWGAHQDLASFAPRTFELWNEPYYPAFSNGDIDPGRYARLVKAAGSAGHAANGQAKFLMAAETDVRPTATNQWVSWTDAMYQAVPDLNNYFDAVAVHPYSGNLAPDATSGAPIHERFDRIGLIHDRMVAKGASNKPFWITEVGWSTCSDSSACVNEATQADYTARLFHVVSSTYRSFVAALFLYRSSDLGPSGSSDREANFGLAHEDGSPKPAWASVRAAAGA
jgi:hypothetical protein